MSAEDPRSAAARTPAARTAAGRTAAGRAAAAVREARRSPELLRVIRSARGLLPGDEHDRGETTTNRELALAAMQVWQALSQRLGRGAGSVEAAVLFTELCGFSSWVLKAGDEAAVELLRAVAAVVEPCITAHQGKVVKRLADGHMAIFPDASEALEATLDIQEKVSELSADDHPPRLRAGLHCGRPRQMGSDYLGADVNIAARLSEAARAGEVLVSGDVLARIGEDEHARLAVKRRRTFRAKGAPPALEAFCVTRA